MFLINSLSRLPALLCLGLCSLLVALPLHSKSSKPNVVLIMADDFGVGSINAYGAPQSLVRTPYLNELAAKGMRFTNANTPGSICSPTRYALLTGRYAWRGPLPFGVVNVEDPLVVETDRETMPKFFQKAGYRTAQIGKWHLGYGDKEPVDYTAKLVPGPNQVGFDYHFGLPQNLDDLLRVWIENDEVYGLRSKTLSPYGKSFYGMQYMGIDAPQRSRETASAVMTDKAIEWVKKTHRSAPETPFFLYFAPAATHHPIVPSEEMRGSSGSGAYGDFIQDLDLSVGRLIKALEYEGLAENTLFLFTSDNGGDIPENDPSRPENQAKEAGLRANGEHRGDKHTIYEGGVRVPLIVRWDSKITANSATDRMVSIVDLYSTLAEAATGELPSAQEAPDSISFAPTLMGQQQEPRLPMISSNAPGLHALRHENWKYIDGKFPEGVDENQRRHYQSQATPSLFNLEKGGAEENNLYDEYPEVVAELQRILDQYREKPTRQQDPIPN